MDKDSEKAENAADALRLFFEQFGPPDVYNRVLLEVLFEELFNVKDKDAEQHDN